MIKGFSAVLISTFAVFVAAKSSVDQQSILTKYLANFSINNIDCFAQVNGVPIMDNMYSTQGPSFAGK